MCSHPLSATRFRTRAWLHLVAWYSPAATMKEGSKVRETFRAEDDAVLKAGLRPSSERLAMRKIATAKKREEAAAENQSGLAVQKSAFCTPLSAKRIQGHELPSAQKDRPLPQTAVPADPVANRRGIGGDHLASRFGSEILSTVVVDQPRRCVFDFATFSVSAARENPRSPVE